MQTVAIEGIFKQLRRRSHGAQSDAELLDDFIANRDEAAFAELVHRHRAKVYAVCRRVLGRHHLTEDACQATFLVLAKKAQSVHPRAAVGGFLYGAARIAALEAYALSHRRKEKLVARVPDLPADAHMQADSEALAALDEEIANLSETLRAAVVLCELDGVSRAEAARQLGIPTGTLSSRLAAARKQLATNLKARGVTSIATLLTILATSANAATPTALKVVSSTASEICQGVLRTMLRTVLLAKLRNTAVVCATVAAFTLWAFAPAQLPAAVEGPRLAGAFAVSKDPVPKENQEPRENAFVVGRLNGVSKLPNAKRGEWDSVTELLGPDGKSRGFVPVGELMDIRNPRVSPDGKLLAFFRQGRTSQDERRGRLPPPKAGPLTNEGLFIWYPMDLYVVDLGSKKPPAEPLMKDLRCASLAWSSDSRQLYISSVPGGKEAIAKLKEKAEDETLQERNPTIVMPVKTWLFDLAAKKETLLDIPEGHGVYDSTPDGKTVLTRKIVWNQMQISSTSYLVPLTTLKPRAITADEEGFDHARFSPDGSRVAGIRTEFTKSKEKGLFLYDVAKESLSRVPLPQGILPEKLTQVAWAPDGKQIALLWGIPVGRPGGGAPGLPGSAGGMGGGGGIQNYRISAFDLNGENMKLIREYKGTEQPFGLDWADLVCPKK
jgi:RNA polymerase sigma factor (sigma-70 family)